MLATLKQWNKSVSSFVRTIIPQAVPGSERWKLETGRLHFAGGEELHNLRMRARRLCAQFNRADPDDFEGRAKILKELLQDDPEGLCIEPPFTADYGFHLKLGKYVYFNFNCCILDDMDVKIGDYCLFAPNVQIYTATHPVDGNIRLQMLEYSKPVVIGKACWIGGNATICPGVTLGDNVSVAAGSVVTKSFPSNCVIGGNPAKLIKTVPPLKEIPDVQQVLAGHDKK